MKKLMLYMMSALLLTSCSHAFKEKLRKTAETDIPFTSVQASIDRDTGSVFIWGGVIVNSVITGSDNFIEVVQNPLDKYGKVIDPEVSMGRFIVYSPSGLNKEEHSRGRLLTTIGFLVKGVNARVKGQPYTYPVMEAIDIRLWDNMEGSIPEPYFPSKTGSIIP